MKIAIYGGSFNPPHIGHVNAAKLVVEKIKADRILIIPDYIAPHKQMSDDTPEAEKRFEMCQLAFEEVEGAVVSDIEIQRKGKSYTSDTIALLRMQFPDDDFYLVMGTDMLLSFNRWHLFEQILSEVTLVVISRWDDDDKAINECALELKEKYGAKIVHLDKEKDGAKIIHLDDGPIVVSSTELREKIKKGEDTGFLQPQVLEYIKNNHLYLGE